MNPGAYSNLQIVNATARHLIAGSNPPVPPAFNAYQMWAWFNWPGQPPVPIVPARTAMLYPIVALSGDGDEDDAANLLLAFNDADSQETNVLALYAGSYPDSAHYLQAVPLSQNGSLVVAGVCAGTLLMADASSMRWFSAVSGNPAIPLGVFPNADQALVVADLAVLFAESQSVSLFESIVSSSLSPADQQTLYNAVTPYAI